MDRTISFCSFSPSLLTLGQFLCKGEVLGKAEAWVQNTGDKELGLLLGNVAIEDLLALRAHLFLCIKLFYPKGLMRRARVM